ncbi:hypothetical protein CQ026_15780 [Brevundimonas sp. MYb31]|nr:hypothetical protein CQ026_15780 [Brevundimonas sp. MYb31]
MDGALDQVAPFVRALDAGKELASALKVVEQRAQLLQDEKLGLATELERDRKAGAERVTKIAELEQKVEVFEGETTRLTAELERDRKAGAERAAEQTAKLAELEQRAAIFAEEKSRLATELEHERKAGVEREAQQAARLTELEGALRQRGLEAEEWFEENGRLAQAHAALQAEMKKLEDEREEDLGRLQENLRTRDNQIRVLEKNVEERFEEIAKVSQILLDIQAQQEEWRRELQQSNERITILSQKNEQLKRVGFKKLMARYSRNIRHSLKMIDRPA